jgi:hypothetical protein
MSGRGVFVLPPSAGHPPHQLAALTRGKLALRPSFILRNSGHAQALGPAAC